jgi:AcrR family transcriptional regulator
VADSEETKRRILSAATAEFAARGIAGARVDRIAASSGASKPMLYAYFGSKRKLFDAVFTSHVIANSARVPFDADDLPGYAVRLYDDYLADPALLRLVAWKRLELAPTEYLYGDLVTNDEAHFEAIAQRQRRGVIRSDIAPMDVWSLVISTASTWSQISVTTVSTPGDTESVHQHRREALADMVREGLCTGKRAA